MRPKVKDSPLQEANPECSMRGDKAMTTDNTIRPIALGRNNYLFAGSHDAAQNAAMIYSLLATCKLHRVNAYDWLKYVLTVMPTHPANRIQELLPHNWKASLS